MIWQHPAAVPVWSNSLALLGLSFLSRQMSNNGASPADVTQACSEAQNEVKPMNSLVETQMGLARTREEGKNAHEATSRLPSAPPQAPQPCLLARQLVASASVSLHPFYVLVIPLPRSLFVAVSEEYLTYQLFCQPGAVPTVPRGREPARQRLQTMRPQGGSNSTSREPQR